MNDRERFLVVGGDGLIGQALLRQFAGRNQDACGTTRRPDRVSSRHILLDLGQDLGAWRPPADCSVAFLCAAVTNQEKCRQDPSHARLLNVTRTADLAHILIDAGVFVVFLSTNLVFDGTTPASPSNSTLNPQTEYGRQKALAEQSLVAADRNIAVVRLAKVFHRDMPLLKKWADLLRRAETISPLDDLLCSPISLDFVVQALERIGSTRAPGIFQVSGGRDVSYAEIALRLARFLGVNEQLVRPASSGQLGLRLEHLPRHTTMDVSRLANQLDLTPPDVWTVLDSVFTELPVPEK